MRTVAATICIAALTAAMSTSAQRGAQPAGRPVDAMAERYVKLVLALGKHDADYVDAYYGPPEWKQAAESTKLDLNAIGAAAAELNGELAREPAPSDEMA